MDKIFLSSLSVECIVGIWEWERRVKQTVIIDLEMAADIRRAAASDRIEDTIDYKQRERSACARSSASRSSVGGDARRAHRARDRRRSSASSWVKVRLSKHGAIRGDARRRHRRSSVRAAG